MTTILYVGCGGALGAVSRYLCSSWISRWAESLLPYGTLFVNILGSFILGFIYIISINTAVISSEMRALVTIGFIGSFTTFSTFSTETINLFKGGNSLYAGLYLGGSIFLGLAAVLLGMACGNYFFGNT